MSALFTPQRLIYDRQIARENETMNRIRQGAQGKDGQWIPGPLWWLWHCTETFDNHWLEKGFSGPHRPFPVLPYFKWLFARMLTRQIMFFPKSREMMLSWCAIGYCTWFCQLFPSTLVLVQSQKLEKASELVKGKEPPGYAYALYDRQHAWLKERFPLAMRPEDLPADKLVWANGSAIQAIGRGADQVRLYHPTIYVIDECAFMEEAAASFGAATPVAKQILIISSAGPGWFGDICSEE